MQFSLNPRVRPAAKHAPEELLRLARLGDQSAREELLARYAPFIVRAAARATGRYVRPGSDEEYSVALSAFNEAIDGYSSDRGGFLTFAETVIKRRLIDHYRRETRRPETPISDFEDTDDEGNVGNPVLLRESLLTFGAEAENEDRREEITRFCRELQAYGLTLAELARIAPKHEDARRSAIAVSRLLAADRELREYLRRKRELPLKALAEIAPVSRKTLERQRKYIIAVSLILLGDYPHLQGYLG